MVLFGQSSCVLLKVVFFVQKTLCSGKSGCIRQNGFVRDKVVVIRQSGCIRVKVVVFGQSICVWARWFYSGKVVLLE